jgi:hypothetical protein
VSGVVLLLQLREKIAKLQESLAASSGAGMLAIENGRPSSRGNVLLPPIDGGPATE